MANTKEIQARISSIHDTMKITLLLWITGSDKKYIISFSYYAASFL